MNRGWFAENNVEVGDEIDIEEGKKDACYHKVKSRYSVWPSAYASGALVNVVKLVLLIGVTRPRKKDMITPTGDLISDQPSMKQST